MLKQNLSHKMLQKLSPQQIQLMKLLQIPTATLEQRVKEELEANPALEEGEENEEHENNDLSMPNGMAIGSLILNFCNLLANQSPETIVWSFLLEI